VKEFHAGGTSPFQAGNELANLEKARLIHPDHVVKAQALVDPRQGWIVKEKVILNAPTPADLGAGKQIEQDLADGGIQDIGGNVVFGHTADNPTPRWILLE
jgi:hypothetical protein